jgi:hypothetical protein
MHYCVMMTMVMNYKPEDAVGKGDLFAFHQNDPSHAGYRPNGAGKRQPTDFPHLATPD